MTGQADADTGLASARTDLAWQRTALATAAGAAIMARLSFDQLGVPALLTLGAALLLSAWLLLESRWRPRRSTRSGRAPAWLAAAVVLMALTELAAVALG